MYFDKEYDDIILLLLVTFGVTSGVTNLLRNRDGS